MIDCYDKEMVKSREQLTSNLIAVNYQYTQISIRYNKYPSLLAKYISTNYYFAIFLKKVFSLVKSTYTKSTTVPPWGESNFGELI